MPYELKEETLNKLGLNKDGTEKVTGETPSTEKSDKIDEHGNEIRSYSDAEIGINIGDEFLKSHETTEKPPKEEKPEKSEEATSEKEHPSKQTAPEKKPDEEISEQEHPSTQEEEKEPTFQDRVIERLKVFEDEETQSKFMKDLENYEKFHATNTKTQQELAEERRQFQQLVNELVGEDYQKVIEEILKLDDLKDFLESADDWYSEREGGNPFRRLIDVWRSQNDNIKNYHEQTSAFEKERSDLELEKEVFEIQKLDDRYKEFDNVIALGDLADEIDKQGGINLKIAHKIWLADNLDKNVSDLSDKIKALEKDKTNLKKELKARNEELTELKSKTLPPSPGITEPIGAESFDYTTPSSGFDETEQRLRMKLGVEA